MENLYKAWNGELWSEECDPFVDNCFWFNTEKGEGIFVNDAHEFKIVRHTGLKIGAHNGTQPIWEGDILRIKLPAGGFWGNIKVDKVGIVRYEPDYGGYIVQWEYSRHQHHERLTCDIAHGAEYLGNVHSDKELITEYNL